MSEYTGTTQDLEEQVITKEDIQESKRIFIGYVASVPQNEGDARMQKLLLQTFLNDSSVLD